MVCPSYRLGPLTLTGRQSLSSIFGVITCLRRRARPFRTTSRSRQTIEHTGDTGSLHLHDVRQLHPASQEFRTTIVPGGTGQDAGAVKMPKTKSGGPGLPPAAPVEFTALSTGSPMLNLIYNNRKIYWRHLNDLGRIFLGYFMVSV